MNDKNENETKQEVPLALRIFGWFLIIGGALFVVNLVVFGGSSFMSNAKWRKCFNLLESLMPKIQVIWKFVGSKNNGVRHSIPLVESLEENY